MKNLISKKCGITIQEIGGEMHSIWEQYFNDCKALIYVINRDNVDKIGINMFNLIKILSHPLIKNKKPILIVLSKLDLLSSFSFKELVDHVLFLNNIIKSFPLNSIKITECSSLTGEGIESILKWIYETSAKL